MIKINSEPLKVVVVGSSSIDLVINTEHLPNANESIIANKSESFFGGKGANQAVALSRLGCTTYFVGCIGMDPYGQQIMRNLKDENVNVSLLYENVNLSTGMAYVTSAHGENTIVVVPSANQSLDCDHIINVEKIAKNADFVLTQLENSIETTEFLIEKCFEWGIKLGLYASPAKKIKLDFLHKTNFIVLKDSDFETVFPNENKEDILKQFPNRMFLRYNNNSTTYFNGIKIVNIPSNSSGLQHKMGINDAFTSGYCFASYNQNSTEDSVKFGQFIAEKVSEKRGSQTNLPKLSELDLY